MLPRREWGTFAVAVYRVAESLVENPEAGLVGWPDIADDVALVLAYLGWPLPPDHRAPPMVSSAFVIGWSTRVALDRTMPAIALPADLDLVLWTALAQRTAEQSGRLG